MRAVIHANGRYTCYYRKRSSGKKPSYDSVLASCRKSFPHAAFIQVRNRFGKWWCIHYE